MKGYRIKECGKNPNNEALRIPAMDRTSLYGFKIYRIKECG